MFSCPHLQVDPFTSLHSIWKDKSVLVISLVTFLSYLPEAGQSTCFFVYLTLVLGFSKMNVAIFICYVGLVSAVCQTLVLSKMIEKIGPKYSIMVGLISQLIQLVCYGVTSNEISVWVCGLAIALSSITYAAVSAYASLITDKDKQVNIATEYDIELELNWLSGSSPGDADGSEGTLQRSRTSGLRSDVAPLWDRHHQHRPQSAGAPDQPHPGLPRQQSHGSCEE